MKITLINHSDTLGGASKVTYRLMQALRTEGVDARLLVTHRATDDSHVALAASRLRSRMPFIAEHARIFAANGHRRDTLFQISIATDGLPLSRHPLVLDADIVVLNWVNQGMLSLDEIATIGAMKPLVWTMHDMWNMTGVCHHAATCDAYLSGCHGCPLTGRGNMAADTLARKKRLYGSTPIHFVAVSNWLARKARASALLGRMPVTVIHNPLPVETWAMQPTVNPGAAGLPWHGEKIIIFCAARIDDPIKGLPLAIEALNEVADTGATAVFIGELRDPHALDGLRMPHYATGPIYEPERIRAAFSYSSVVLSSSSYETLPTTLIEGQAAGATPVSFVHDGRADIIADGISGYAAGPGIRSLADALRLAIENPLPRQQLMQAALRYSYSEISAQYIKLFNTLINK